MKHFLTAEEAAHLIGVSVPDLESYVDSGFLREIPQSGSIFYNRNDVVRLMEARDSARLPVASTKTLMHMQEEIRSLQSSVNTLLSLFGVAQEPLVMDGTGLSLLYDQMLATITNDNLSLQDVKDWVDVLLRLRHTHLAALVTVTNNDRPWIMLHRLVESLCMYVGSLDVDNHHIRSVQLSVNAARAHVLGLMYTCSILDPARDYHVHLMRQTLSLGDILQKMASRTGNSVLPPAIEAAISLVSNAKNAGV